MNTAAKQALFYSNIQGIGKNTHASAGLSKKINFHFSRDVHMVPLVMAEISAAAVSYPIIFAGEDRSPVAALGLNPDKNVFVDADGNWPQEFYIPAAVRRYPFLMATGPEGKDKFLCVDEDADSFSSSSPEMPFFDGDKPSQLLEQAMRECESFEQNMKQTSERVKEFEHYELYCVKTLSYKDLEDNSDKKIQFTALDENRFKELSADQLLELRNKGFLDLIYAHFLSLSNWNRLIYKHNSPHRSGS